MRVDQTALAGDAVVRDVLADLRVEFQRGYVQTHHLQRAEGQLLRVLGGHAGEQERRVVSVVVWLLPSSVSTFGLSVALRPQKP